MRNFNPSKTTDQLVDFIRASFDRAGFSRAVIAMSGGVDSSAAAALTARALGPEHVFPLILPYGTLSARGMKDAQEVIDALEIPKNNVTTVDIKPLLAPLFDGIEIKDELRRGNAMARMRMIVIYDHAKKRNCLVVGTENKTEHLLGYFTRFGDEASDIEPIKGLYKTEVFALTKHLDIPEDIRTKAPSAGLWKDQTDEGEFGFSYKDADEIFYFTLEKKLSLDEVIKHGYEQRVVQRVMQFAATNDFKHHLPIIPEDINL